MSTRRRTFFRLAAVASTAVMLAVSSSCTLLWIFQNDPQGLPCEAGTNACLEGYTCVVQGAGQLPVCLKAGAKQIGEACSVSEECDEDLTCASQYAVCKESSDDPNCSLVDDAEKELACRTVCDILNPTTCGIDERCYVGTDGIDFCQTGTCIGDGDCQTIPGAAGVCIDEGVRGGKAGLCFQACDPFSCANGACADCTGVDGQPDPDTNCVPPIDEIGILVGRQMCDTPGPVLQGEACNPFGDPCEAGAFCNTTRNPPICTKWCRFPNAAPACDTGFVCEPVSVADDLGFCIPQ